MVSVNINPVSGLRPVLRVIVQRLDDARATNGAGD
jgi:hypothetical protein